MRIGEFAQKHGITQDTIRHYLDMGLLVAEKKGGQYRFVDADSKDVEKIIELKQLDFSLTEIQKILTYQRISGTNTDVFRGLLLAFLEDKKKEVAIELQKYNKMNDFIRDKIHEIKEESNENSQRLGFPINSLHLLVCPNCRGSLNMTEGTVEKSMVIEAVMQCECGYRAVIENGIYIDRTAVRTKLMNGKAMPTKEEYLKSCSHTHVNFLYKGITALIEFINKYGEKPQYIMELANCVGLFLLQHIKYLSPGTTQILIDYDLDRISQLKKNLEMYYGHRNFIFLCCDFHRLPIDNSVVDIIVDYGETKVYAAETGNYLPDIVLPMLRQGGLYASSFQYLGQKSKDNSGLPKVVKEYMNREMVLEKIDTLQLEELEMTDIGPIYENNPQITDLNEIELYQGVYIGRKKTSTK